MDPLATTSDVVAVMGPLTPEQLPVVAGIIAQASLKVRLAARQAGVDIDALGELDRAVLVAAVVNAVVRVLRNPQGLRQFQQTMTAGPYTQTFSGAPAGDGVGVYVDPEDLPWAATAGVFPRTARVRSGYC